MTDSIELAGRWIRAALLAAYECGRGQAADAIRATADPNVPDGRMVLLEREHAARIAEGRSTAPGSTLRAQVPGADLVEQLSEAAHEAWMETKDAQGVTFRNSEWGEDLMVPYVDLSERAKDLDRGTVRGVLAAIERAGYRVTPKFAQGGPVERPVDLWLGPPRRDTVRLADLDLQQDG